MDTAPIHVFRKGDLCLIKQAYLRLEKDMALDLYHQVEGILLDDIDDVKNSSKSSVNLGQHGILEFRILVYRACPTQMTLDYFKHRGKDSYFDDGMLDGMFVGNVWIYTDIDAGSIKTDVTVLSSREEEIS